MLSNTCAKSCVLQYVDDFAGAEKPEYAMKSFQE